MPRDCPECGNPLSTKAVQCNGCGYSLTGKSGGVIDHNHMRCEWMSGGDRCRYPGSISPGTTGGGPWYCREHFGCSDMAAGAEIVARSVAEIPAGMSYSGESMREAARRAFLARGWPEMPPAVAGVDVPGTVLQLTKDPLKRQRDPKDWARRILQREAAGEHQPIYAVTSAREALGL